MSAEVHGIGETAVALFLRYPTPGRVKTRLAATIGSDAATQFYTLCAEKTVDTCSRLPGQCYIFYSAVEEGPLVQQWLNSRNQKNLIYLPQASSHILGDRLADAARQCLSQSHPKVLIVGTDVPDLSAKILERAMRLLDSHQIVFGPSVDGGYYLIGLGGTASIPPQLFDEIAWSTSTVLQQNVANAEGVGLNVAPLDSLPKLRDIDTIEDLKLWRDGASAQDGRLAELATEIIRTL